MIEAIHWIGTAVLMASLLIQIMPTPEEIPNKVYLVIFNTIRRTANLKMSASWKNGNGS